MPTYKLHAASYLNDRHLPAGSVVEFDGNPGSQMEPMDAAAWDKFHAYTAERVRSGQGVVTRYPFKVIEGHATETVGPVDIPADWHNLKGMMIIHLARRLGAPRDVKGEAAKVFVEAEVAKRAGSPAPKVAQANPVMPPRVPHVRPIMEPKVE